MEARFAGGGRGDVSLASPLPTSIRTGADARALEAAATREVFEEGEHRLAWRTWGEGPPVVLLHGGSGSWTHWVRNIAALVRAGRRVLVPDLPGFGDSIAAPGVQDAAGLEVPLEATLSRLAGREPCDFACFSFGAMVGAFLAAEKPSRARRLVLVGAPALGIPGYGPPRLRPWLHLPEGEERDAAHRANLASLMFADPASVDDLSVALHSANLARDRMKRRRIAFTDILRRTLREVRCPVHGIWGERDVLFRGIEAGIEPALREARDFRDLAFVAGAGHWVQYEAPEAFDAALAAALGQP